MNILIRVDASHKIGTGHFRRCFCLATEFVKRGHGVHFASSDLPQEFITEIQHTQGMFFHLLSRPVDDPQSLISVLEVQEHVFEWLIIDHYGLAKPYESALRPYVGKILVVDDLANREHDCDVLLDASDVLCSQERYSSLVPQSCSFLLGPRYVPLRADFLTSRNQRRRTRIDDAQNFLIFFGGSDPHDLITRYRSVWQWLVEKKKSLDVVLPLSNQDKDGESFGGRITYHKNVQDMASLMQKADVYIGSGGTITWERCCLGLPGVVVAAAENQVASSKILAQKNCQMFLGLHNQVTDQSLQVAIQDLLKTPGRVEEFAKNSSELVDGRGAQRVVTQLLAQDLVFDVCKPADAKRVYSWRNHADVRRYSGDDSEIAWPDHEKWFLQSLNNPNRILWIAQVKGDPISVLRFDIDGSKATISIYLTPGHFGESWGAQIVTRGTDKLWSERPKVQKVIAVIQDQNQPSIKALSVAGFVKTQKISQNEALYEKQR